MLLQRSRHENDVTLWGERLGKRAIHLWAAGAPFWEEPFVMKWRAPGRGIIPSSKIDAPSTELLLVRNLNWIPWLNPSDETVDMRTSLVLSAANMTNKRSNFIFPIPQSVVEGLLNVEFRILWIHILCLLEFTEFSHLMNVSTAFPAHSAMASDFLITRNSLQFLQRISVEI